MKRTFILSALLVALAAWPQAYAGEPDHKAGEGGGGRGNWGGRNMGDIGAALGGMFGGGRGGMGGITNMVSRMLGFDMEDPKAGPKLDALPLGADKRFIFNVPVGGVDNLSSAGNGWRVELVFKMTEEQTKSVEALRAEYKAEEKKCGDEIQAQYKAMADKLKQLRLKYEQRANDVLTGDDKQRKEKMDALARETAAKNVEIVTESQQLYDANDPQQNFAMIRAIRERIGKNTTASEAKLLELVPPDSKEKMEGVIKQQAEARDQTGRLMNFAGGRGRPGGEGGDAVKPPRPPEADKKADF